MNRSHSENVFANDPNQQLDLAIQTIVDSPAPVDVCQKLIDNAAAWEQTIGFETETSQSEQDSAYAIASCGITSRDSRIIESPLPKFDKDNWPSAQQLAFGLAIMAIFVFAVTLFIEAKIQKPNSTAVTKSNSGHQTPTNPPAAPAVVSQNDNSPRGYAVDAFAYRVPNIRTSVAENAPVIVANGGEKPLMLGEEIPRDAKLDHLHVWDWSKSAKSRIIPGFEFSNSTNAVLTPNGDFLVFADGTHLVLKTGATIKMDYGPEPLNTGTTKFKNAGGMQFSPDSRRLGLLVNLGAGEIPGNRLDVAVKVVETPAGQTLCQFPAGEKHTLRIGFSANGEQIVAGNRKNEVELTDVKSGQVERTFAPALKTQLMGVTLSPDGRFVAAHERTNHSNNPDDERHGRLYVWNKETGELLHQIDSNQFKKAGGLGAIYGLLRFSPNGEHLAVETWGRLMIVDVPSGRVVASLPATVPRHVQWSADGETITTISAVAEATPKNGAMFGDDKLPVVEIWDWRNEKLLKRVGKGFE